MSGNHAFKNEESVFLYFLENEQILFTEKLFQNIIFLGTFCQVNLKFYRNYF